jgi:hypothetical protein
MAIVGWPGGCSETKAFIIALIALTPLSVGAKKKKESDRAMLEKMEAVPCGTKQHGFTGVGSIWASVGITHVNSDEKLCPQYLLRTDDMEYEIRRTDRNHPVILPVGQEGQFKIKHNRMFLSFPETYDRKKRTYEVVSIKQLNADTAERQSSTPEKP